jgi:hypothetical protein
VNARGAVIVVDGDGRQLGVLTSDRRSARAAGYGRLVTESLLAELDEAGPFHLATKLLSSRQPHSASPNSPLKKPAASAADRFGQRLLSACPVPLRACMSRRTSTSPTSVHAVRTNPDGRGQALYETARRQGEGAVDERPTSTRLHVPATSQTTRHEAIRKHGRRRSTETRHAKE